MRTKITIIATISAISFVIILIFYFYIQGQKKGENIQKINYQQEQIEVQNEIIKENKKVFARKVINKSYTTESNVSWLQQNICQDCQN